MPAWVARHDTVTSVGTCCGRHSGMPFETDVECGGWIRGRCRVVRRWPLLHHDAHRHQLRMHRGRDARVLQLLLRHAQAHGQSDHVLVCVMEVTFDASKRGLTRRRSARGRARGSAPHRDRVGASSARNKSRSRYTTTARPRRHEKHTIPLMKMATSWMNLGPPTERYAGARRCGRCRRLRLPLWRADT